MLLVLAMIGVMAPAVVTPARPALAGQTTFMVTKTADTNDGACTERDCSLREAIIAANAMGNTDIEIPAGVYKLTINGADEDFGATGDLDLRKSVNIRGAGARKTIVDGRGIDRVIHTPIQGIQPTPFTVSIVGVTITGGAAPRNFGGGGIFHQARGATLYLTDSTVGDNTASWGGGIYNGGGQGFGETMIIRRSTISGNRAPGGEGGGIFITENMTIENVTISGNRSRFGGGLEHASSKPLRITDSTIAFNHAQQPGGGIYTRIPGMTILKNTIVSHNTSDFQDNCNFPVTSEGNNLEQGMTCGFDQPGDQNVDPRLGTLANNGGPTDTHALLKGSPAINRGGAPFPPTDQRGVARPRSAVNDIGAVEMKRRKR
jgi:CSLREA domain-containing protein